MVIPKRGYLIVIKQPATSNMVQHRATWVRKSHIDGRVWLTNCRIKQRMKEVRHLPIEYMCQTQRMDLVDEVWEMQKRTEDLDEALRWLYQS